MDDVLDTLAQPQDAAEPVVALDERPVVLRDSARQGRCASPGRLARMDYEYVRRGTANIFCIVEPKAGRHMTFATPNRKGCEFARALRKIARRYSSARTIHLVMDNLSTHSQNSLCTAFGDQAGRALWNRFTVHYTPKHGSWLNPAEIEASLWSRECLGRLRIGSLAELRRRTSRWNADAHRRRRKITWRFTKERARSVFKIDQIDTARSRH
ncbi:IS630 family transposase [Nannocystis sp. SCPEA4]|uniref:IS630 family transposase n=1 Tax=Nannocystis sp. SCPEA4 TaxID=2996787 RepID=UPI00226FDF56|nr:IS630 family transposase [Nannocystis sp. SCPEA4]MCY1053542.1 IS630 family transposase [Nannocystis sp. SCPEA4]MCY1058199.1 IS630 family transposase [Nannocystis sp. SCPEA4]MCY1058262.1 IS630 family transposase [Nannocystis sp. SCPEA4]MCY1059874.1 IS630 family transposase [Nannocystis sp. SCPEA4]MCY1062695.1 IS630 family transposase [Nannocystis sp. SCPEA4]